MAGSDYTNAAEMLLRDLGDLLAAELEDPSTLELSVNPDNRIFVEKLGRGLAEIGVMEPTRAESIIQTVSGLARREATTRTPILECELQLPGHWLHGSRFSGWLPDIVAAPAFTIRKHTTLPLTLADYEGSGAMSARDHQALLDAFRRRQNILIAGGTTTGKTTLLNAAIRSLVKLFPEQRLVILEDTRELQSNARNTVAFRADQSAGITLTELLATTLRARPDRILVGEVRGPEALDLLMAWGTGHPGGVASIHSDSAEDTLDRFLLLISMNPKMPRRPIEPMLARAINVIVYMIRDANERPKVAKILQVMGYKDGEFVTQPYELENDR